MGYEASETAWWPSVCDTSRASVTDRAKIEKAQAEWRPEDGKRMEGVQRKNRQKKRRTWTTRADLALETAREFGGSAVATWS